MMKISDYQQFELNFDCDEVRELLLLYVLDRGDLSLDERWAIERHLEGCDGCRDEYEKTRFVNDALVANRDELAKESVFKDSKHENEAEQMPDDKADFLQFQAKMHRAIARRKKADKQKRWIQLGPVVKVVSAVAACLVVGLVGFFAANQMKASNSSSPIASAPQQNSVKIEVVADGGAEIVPAGQLITASDELKTLRINGNRQMVLNIGTELSIEPYNLGCLIKLDKGEIFTEVEHDGKPFVVETSHGRAVITGTTFNIKADHDKMDLAVIEGSVQFESEKGNVNVKGGFQSSIIADMKPSIPVACDAIQIAQWAKGQKSNETNLFQQPDIYFSKMLDLPVTFIPYCELEDINFDVWINQNREWFEREFPWTKRLQKLLAEDGIEVDTIDLLIESGDLWRFAWPEYNLRRILAEDPKIIKKIAGQYGIEVDKLISSEVIQCKQTPNIEAFKKWFNAFDEEQSNIILDSIHAVAFLINTRSLAWYAVNDGHIQVKNQQVLDLLSEQVQIASNMLITLNQLLLADKDKSVCSKAQYDEFVRNLKDDIPSIMEIEREFVDGV
jgi:ferric-dicitrate binding protein FerR (iron transport regulator)/ribosomal 50S subunit-recycling heat shock protein